MPPATRKLNQLFTKNRASMHDAIPVPDKDTPVIQILSTPRALGLGLASSRTWRLRRRRSARSERRRHLRIARRVGADFHRSHGWYKSGRLRRGSGRRPGRSDADPDRRPSCGAPGPTRPWRCVSPRTGERVGATILASDADADIAIVEAEACRSSRVTLKSNVRLGDDVWVISFLGDGRGTAVNGVVSQIAGDGAVVPMEGSVALIDAVVGYGTSGRWGLRRSHRRPDRHRPRLSHGAAIAVRRRSADTGSADCRRNHGHPHLATSSASCRPPGSPTGCHVRCGNTRATASSHSGPGDRLANARPGSLYSASTVKLLISFWPFDSS